MMIQRKKKIQQKENPDTKTELSEEQRSAISASIATALSTKGHKSTKTKKRKLVQLLRTTL